MPPKYSDISCLRKEYTHRVTEYVARPDDSPSAKSCPNNLRNFKKQSVPSLQFVGPKLIEWLQI